MTKEQLEEAMILADKFSLLRHETRSWYEDTWVETNISEYGLAKLIEFIRNEKKGTQ
jgi:hypothetical protein